MESAVDLQKAKTKLERQNLLPDLTAEYFQGTNSGLNKNLIGYQFGIKIPLLFNGQRAKIKAAKLAQESLEEEQLDYEVKLKAKYNSLLQKLQQYEEALNYYNQQGDSLSREILKTANRTYKEGEINFFQYIQSIETAKQIQLEYLENLNNYNQTIIELNFIIL
jgi:cobalt-zinc-cadmium resistance protein CzcA